MLSCKEQIYGNIRIIHGKKYDYLGMDLEYSIRREVKISTVYYLNKVIKNFPEEIWCHATSNAVYHMFKVRDKLM